jgi:GDPmannose 4,6-dehydratase
LRQIDKPIKFFQANSSELFKGLDSGIINETTLEFYPKNPYAIGKLLAYWTVRYYREYHNIYACNGIIFNAESPHRNIKYVLPKIVKKLNQILTTQDEILFVGNIDARRDWIHASDVATAIQKILQEENPKDFIIGSGATHSVRDFIECVFSKHNIYIKWEGMGVEEKGYDNTGRLVIAIDPTLFRPYENNNQNLVADNQQLLSTGWAPQYSWDDLIADLLSNIN